MGRQLSAHSRERPQKEPAHQILDLGLPASRTMRKYLSVV